VVRTRTAAVEAARALFLRQGYAGTTMDDIAAAAGLTKRTLYNNYADKQALFTQIVGEVSGFARGFARGLRDEFGTQVSAANLRAALDDFAQRLTLAVLRPEVIALRRLLIAEARTFPALARDYYDSAPGQVIDAVAKGFARFARRNLLRVADPRRAAAQFAYLAVGEPLDRAMLTGAAPAREDALACAREGVETFMARYGTQRAGGQRR
jgi:TetR/AcrR family transcriptional repressor of mexJK operon